MTLLSVIVARDKNGVIGKGNAIPWNIPEDMRFFRECTVGLPVIMGRNTWLSLHQKPLPFRMNLIISSQPIDRDDVYVFPTLNAARSFLEEAQMVKAFVIGGQRLYDEAMQSAVELYMTTFPEIEVEAGDTVFDQPQLKDHRTWERSYRHEFRSVLSLTHPGTLIRFERYLRVGL